MSGQVVLVTGAASGIGAAIALSFAKRSAGLCITDINESDLHEVSVECQKVSKNKVLNVVADLTKDENLDNIVKCALEEFGKIDVLINCAGIWRFTILPSSDIMENYEKHFAINLRSVVALTNKTLPTLIENKGCVINLSSVGATLNVKGNVIYSMTKAAVTTFTQCAAFELANMGVRVNCISPGPVRTNILKNAGYSGSEEHKLWEGFAGSTALKKYVKAEEIAELAVYLASDKAASITGSNFVVDGGMLLGTAAVSHTVKNDN